MDCMNCPYIERFKMLENNQREYLARITALERSGAVIETQYQNIMNALNEQKTETQRQLDKISADIEELKQKPAERWDKATITAMTTVISAVIGYIVGKIFGG